MKEQLASLGIQALEALLPFIVVLVGALLTAATRYVQNRTKNQAVHEALDRFDEVAMAAVKEVQQTFIDKLDAKDPASLEKAKQAAVDTIKSHYGEKGIEKLRKILGWGDIQKALSMKVEEKVHDMKIERASAGLETPTK